MNNKSECSFFLFNFNHFNKIIHITITKYELHYTTSIMDNKKQG